LQVFLSQTGELPAEAAVFHRPELEVVVVTTSAGAARARETGAAVLELGVEVGDLPVLVETLRARFEVRMLLCEGGPRVYGSILAAAIACDEFLTLSPLVLGDGDGGAPRPSLVEGVRFGPRSAPRSRLLNVRRGGDHLYLRSRYWA
jgi:riboflavin biosynthesis pyrimidine reductase